MNTKVEFPGVSIINLKNILRKSAFHIHNLLFEKEAIIVKNKESEFTHY